MIELGLQRITRLLARTPLFWRAIHVAGTNGKGSICAYVSAMLDAYNKSAWRKKTNHSPLRHGRYTSPHLVDRWDCISINQQTISFSIFEEVEKMVLERNKREAIGAMEFELLTATAFEIFTREVVEVGVVEVGMGGRLDATNVIGQSEDLDIPEGSDAPSFRPAPLATAISSIGLDHQAFLGETLEEIAREKAGILKPGVPVVYDISNPISVREVIDSISADKNCSIIRAAPDCMSEDLVQTALRSLCKLGTDSSRAETLPLSGRDDHLKTNARVAFLSTWTALKQLQRVSVSDRAESRRREETDLLAQLVQDMLAAVTNTTFPGRQQYINIERLSGRKKDVLLDGAHNADSAWALSLEIQSQRPGKITWVLAASDSKDAREILKPLLRDGDDIVVVQFGPVDGMPWVKPLSELHVLDAAKAVVPNSRSLNIQCCGSDVLAALKAAGEMADGGPMVIAGSLYLVGDVLRLLRET